jgi:hypothetical protein
MALCNPGRATHAKSNIAGRLSDHFSVPIVSRQITPFQR